MALGGRLPSGCGVPCRQGLVVVGSWSGGSTFAHGIWEFEDKLKTGTAKPKVLKSSHSITKDQISL